MSARAIPPPLRACVYLAALLALGACSPHDPEPVAAAPPVGDQARRVSYGALPPELAPYTDKIDASRLAYIDITLKAAQRLAPWNSRLGGPAYLPKGHAYPRDPDGVPLALLAQLNFAEMPALDGYPATGLLQFFIAGGESRAHSYGSAPDFPSPFDEQRYLALLSAQRYFRVVHHPRVEQNPQKLVRPHAAPVDALPFSGTAGLVFKIDTAPVSVDDYRFERYLGKPRSDFFRQFGVLGTDLLVEYAHYANKEVVAQVGGYSNPAQDDPRASWPDDDWIVLLELHGSEADQGLRMMWGDMGMGAFYIRRNDLQRRDFSKVLYYVDSH
ncbi:YwqG family protein [Massilia aquatica]|uniref:YwqG family protein n=1 Tax=Massilia aquatica TaxID=2609000 RepID=UPI00141DF251